MCGLNRALASAFAILVSCADPPFPDPPSVPVPPSATGGPRAGGSASAASPVAFSLFERDEAAYAFFKQSLARPAKSLEPRAAESSLTAIAVVETGRGEAKDVSEPAALFGATLEEGDRAVLPLARAEPDCVTVVAHGGLGVAEVDAYVVEGPDASPRVIGEDGRPGPIAVVGGLGGCRKASSDCGPICLTRTSESPRVEIVVRRGSGPVVVGVLRRPAVAAPAGR